MIFLPACNILKIMPLKRYKPTTPGRRFASVLYHKKEGVQDIPNSLKATINEQSGRNAQGKITVRHQGGSHRRHYRQTDFDNPVLDKPGKVIGLQYDPNRSGELALLAYGSGRKAYTLAVAGLKVGDSVEASRAKILEIKPGNRLILKHIPAGMTVSNIELFPEKGAKVVRSAGSGASVLSSEDRFVLLKMPSGEIRRFSSDCLATIGQVSNPENSLVRLGKAGRMRHRGVRPRVRGKAMNPVDHPHGGGEGHNPIGMKHPKTPWGKPALGVPTRKPHRGSDALIVRRRKK